MQSEEHRVDAIDLERVIFDPEYRRAVIDELKALRHDERMADQSAYGRGDSDGSEEDQFVRSTTD